MLAGEKGFLNVYDFNSKKWEENHSGIQESIPNAYYYLVYGCTSTITFDKDGKQKLMVLLSKFCKLGCSQIVSRKTNSFFF